VHPLENPASPISDMREKREREMDRKNGKFFAIKGAAVKFIIYRASRFVKLTKLYPISSADNIISQLLKRRSNKKYCLGLYNMVNDRD
jgi:hypothetical protein